MNFGTSIQTERIRDCDQTRRMLITFEQWEQEARRLLDPRSFSYAASGAGDESTIRANLESFQRWRIVPRILRDVADRDLSVKLFGQTFPFPVGFAPIGRQAMFHEQGEVASAKAAAILGIPFIQSMVSSYSLEKVADAQPSRWFHLFFGHDRDVLKSMVLRAERAGFSAIVPTLDRPEEGWRAQNLSLCVSPFMFRYGIGNFISDPIVRQKYGSTLTPQTMQYLTSNPHIRVEDFRFLRSITKLPIIVKGVLHPEDANMMINYGADGLIVSNHGGRHLDGAIAALEALPSIVDVAEDRVPVMFDSGVRCGADILKALALGAKMVFIGRPYLYGLTIAGETGVRHVIENMVADFDLNLGMAGLKHISDLQPSILSRNS
ncbi:alpha-hydroxy-acid oxidizing protein [Paenibacillus aceris]|uniref:L-lactate oxidase n=1 Tax=Paenibacillus aceris TaxID=869555 RepID=A0ABS4I006_9BACL|nr:alpha-hydroxy-acid oxidizing protein [Paenibacillus aceris]MBP1964243.1 L-lactate dehydrogenase (cytochrome) [Paenibacillus aceris]NHW36566.1 alpha-hydroxy-acid oxidizing protein [Paenibacillus aceris]